MEYLFYLGLFVSLFVFPYQVYISAFISLLLILINIMESYKDKKLINIILKPYNILMFMWFIWGLISVFWVRSLEPWKNHILVLFTAFGYTITAPTLIRRKGLIERTKKILFFSFIINIIIGLFEVRTGIYVFTQNIENIGLFSSLRYPLSFFYNTNDYAVFLVLGIILTLFYDKRSIKKILNTVFLIIMISLSLYLLIMSQSRIALFAAIIAIILKLYFITNAKKIRVFLLLISVLLTFVLFKHYDVINLANEYVIADYSGNIRVNLIKNSLIYLSESNYIGVGAGNLIFYLTNYPIYNTMNIFDGHNWWIEILATYGVVIFGIYIYAYLDLLYRAWNRMHSKNNIKINFLWLILFIVLSIASSSIFQYIWIWIVNAIFYNEVYKEK